MANLETLELTISANAQSATQGIGQLTRSLSALQTAVGKSVGGLIKLNDQLATLKSYGKIKLPNLAKTTGAAAVKAGVEKERSKGAIMPEFKGMVKNGNFASWMYGPRPPVNWKDATGAGSMIPDSEYKKLHPELFIEPGSKEWKRNAEAAQEAFDRNNANASAESPSSAAQAVVQANEAISSSQEEVSSTTQAANNAMQQNAQAVNEAAEEANKGQSAFQAFASKIQTVAKTMLIRTALKAVMKEFTNAWQSAYQWSKNMGGGFAKAVDSVRSSLANVAVSVVKAFAPLMTVVAPILNVVAQGVEYLGRVIQELLKLLGMASELFGATSAEIANTGTNAKAAKNVLAGFDELNVLDNSSGGGGSGSGSKVTDAFSEQINAVKILVAEALLAVGLILAFSGHIPVGLALAAIGAATIAGTVATQWGKLSEQTKGEIATVMVAAGGAMLAIGAILAFSGVKTGLGIALMAVGVANIVTAASLSWNLSDEIKAQIGKIMAIIGGASLVIGAIMAFSGANIPLGIGLMVAGGLSLAGAVALNWDSLKNTIITTFNTIKEKLVNVWDKVRGAVGLAWNAFSEWAGATWDKLKNAWDLIKNNLSGVWELIKSSIVAAWNAFKDWVGTTWNTLKAGWTDIKNKLSAVWSVIEVAIVNAWNQFKNWLNTTWNKLSTAWNFIKDNFSTIWGVIKQGIKEAWEQFKNWLSAKWTQLSNAWEMIKSGFSAIWGAIKGYVSEAWEKVKTWFQVGWSMFSGPWETIKTKISGVWDSIKTAIGNAWGAVKEWFAEGSGSVIQKIKTAWTGVKNWFENSITKPIGNFFKSMVNKVIDGLNWVIEKLNSIGHIKWDGLDLGILGKIQGFDIRFWQIPTVQHIALDAAGAYNIPSGQLFIANEAGPELVGTMDGHTTVANQQQIVEGIRKGVYDAQAEQNALLRRQNDLLLGILEKDTTVNIGASSMLGKTVRQSLRMYETMVGV